MHCRKVLLLSKVVVFVFVRERRGLHLARHHVTNYVIRASTFQVA